MDIPQLRQCSLEGGDEDRVDRNDIKCQTRGTLQSSGNPACSTCSNGVDSRRPSGNVDEMEPIVSKVPFIKQGCMDSDDSTIERLNDGGGDGKSTDGNHGSSDVVHRSSSNNNKDSGDDDDVSRKDVSRQGGNDGIKRRTRNNDIADMSFRSPDVCRNKGGMDRYVGHMSGTDEFGLNLHRDNPLHMAASLTLAGRRYVQPQERDGAEENSQDKHSRPVQPNKARNNVEPFSLISGNEDSRYVALETPTSGEELLAPDTQEQEGSGSIDSEKTNPGDKSRSTDNDHYDSNPIVRDQVKHDLESPATDRLCLATNDFPSDHGQRTNELAAAERLAAAEILAAGERPTSAERLAAWIEQDRQLMDDLHAATLIGHDSWPTDEEALAIEQAVQWDMLRCLVVVFAFVILSVISLSE